MFARRDDADAQSGDGAGLSRFRLARLRAVALFRLLGRLQGDRRDGGKLGLGRGRSACASRSSCPPISQMPPGGLNIRWPDTPLRAGEAAARAEDGGGRGLRPRQPHRPPDHRSARARASASSPPASPISTCARRWTSSGLDRRAGGGARHPALQGRPDLAARTAGRAALRHGPERGAGGRGKARLHRGPARRASSTTCPPTAARASSARPTRRARRCCRAQGELDPDHDRARDRRAAGASRRRHARRCSSAWRGSRSFERLPRSRRPRRRAHAAISAPAARTTPRPACRKAAARWPASAATSWRTGCRQRHTAPSATWAARAPPGSARRRSPPTRTCSRIIGDGTYSHSGLLAIRAAAAAGVNITYKILFNDAVAMTGGQPVEGRLTVPQITRQVAAEGAQARSSSSPTSRTNIRRMPDFAAGRRRSATATSSTRVQRELREIPGLTVLVYDQTCAAEKRRRRKRGTYPDPHKRVFINEAVCEGCGDCSDAVELRRRCKPVETEFGRKRTHRPVRAATRISPASRASARASSPCMAAQPRKARSRQCGAHDRRSGRRSAAARAAAARASPTASWSPASAAPASSRSARCSAWRRISKARAARVLDFTGLAQKNGAVMSHVRIAADARGPPRRAHRIRRRATGAGLRHGGGGRRRGAGARSSTA